MAVCDEEIEDRIESREAAETSLSGIVGFAWWPLKLCLRLLKRSKDLLKAIFMGSKYLHMLEMDHGSHPICPFWP